MNDRRHTQDRDHPGRRQVDAFFELADSIIKKNDELANLVALGNRNFRRYRRRASLGFLVLMASNAIGIKLATDGTAAVQRERRAAIVRNCSDQNGRHNRTVAQLRALVPPHPTVKARAGVTATVHLIDALVPVRDCAALVRFQAPSSP